MAGSIAHLTRSAITTVYHWLPLPSNTCPINSESPYAGPGLDHPASLDGQSLFSGEASHLSSGNRKPKVGSRAQQRHQKVEPGLRGILRYPPRKSVEANRPQIVARIKQHLRKHDLLPPENAQQEPQDWEERLTDDLWGQLFELGREIESKMHTLPPAFKNTAFYKLIVKHDLTGSGSTAADEEEEKAIELTMHKLKQKTLEKRGKTERDSEAALKQQEQEQRARLIQEQLARLGTGRMDLMLQADLKARGGDHYDSPEFQKMEADREKMAAVLDCLISGKICKEELASLPLQQREMVVKAFGYAVDTVVRQDESSRRDGQTTPSGQQTKKAPSKAASSKPVKTRGTDHADNVSASGKADDAGNVGNAGNADNADNLGDRAEVLKKTMEKIARQMDRVAEVQKEYEELQQFKDDFKKHGALELDRILTTELQQRSGDDPSTPETAKLFGERLQLLRVLDCIISLENCSENMGNLTQRQLNIVSNALKHGAKIAQTLATQRTKLADFQQTMRDTQ